VFEPPSRIDATNIAAFRWDVEDMIARYDSLVIDCSEVESIGRSGMRVLEVASRDARVTLVNPKPFVRLMATAFGIDVQIAT
jgi:anti-anti-sigma regulatory factor